MLRRLVVIGLAALAVAACKGDKKQSGPAVAKGNGFTITAGDFKARLEEQSPFMRARYNTLERKKEFLDNLVRFEVLSREAEKQGFRDDPEVQQTLRKIMVQKLVQKRFNDPAGPGAVPDEEVQKYYDEHTAEFNRPKRVRASVAVLQAPAGSPERAKKLAVAKKAVASIQAAEKDKKDPDAFRKIVTEVSEDAASKGAGGDIGLKTAEEIEKAYSKELADKLFELKQGEVSGVVESPNALYVAKVTLVQEAVNRTLDQVKPQIVSRLSREKKAKEFDEWVKKLKDSAAVQVDEKALEAIEVPAAGAPGAQPGGRPLPGAVAPPPAKEGGVTPAGPASTPPAKP